METEERPKEREKRSEQERLVRWRSNPVWIVVVFLVVYFFFCGAIVWIPWSFMLETFLPNLSDDLYIILDLYASTILNVIVLFLLCWLIRPNRYIWKSFLLPSRRCAAAADESDRLADFYGRSRNSFKMLGWGLLLGFLTNFIAAACALIHGDIHLYFEASAGQIPVFLLAFLTVIIQSSSEEWWCRGFLYVRLHERCPLWFVIVLNGALFGFLHILNDGVTILSVLNITVTGIAFSLLRWYTGSIWIVMGLHTAWNFMQNFILGLPNSGFVSKLSVFHLDAANGNSNLIYNYEFGVEGALPTMILFVLLSVVILMLAAKNGRLKELRMKRAQTMADMERRTV